MSLSTMGLGRFMRDMFGDVRMLCLRPAPAPTERGATLPSDVPPCPKCGGKMWDNRLGKRNPKAPDFKCRDRDCDGVIWPPKPARAASKRSNKREEPEPEEALATADEVPAQLGDNEIPF